MLLDVLVKPQDIDTLWNNFSSINDSDLFPAKHSYDNILLAVDFLFAIDLVDINQHGELYKT